MFESAAVALDANEAVFEQAAFEVALELCVDESWQGNTGFSQLVLEGWPVSLDDLVQVGFFWLVAFVAKSRLGLEPG